MSYLPPFRTRRPAESRLAEDDADEPMLLDESAIVPDDTAAARRDTARPLPWEDDPGDDIPTLTAVVEPPQAAPARAGLEARVDTALPEEAGLDPVGTDAWPPEPAPESAVDAGPAALDDEQVEALVDDVLDRLQPVLRDAVRDAVLRALEAARPG